ncbi:YdgH/BhsA/McbA-like domain containing protein [Providencia stuartii]|uniref:YdgH/BhsA/McbA-like domain containing protein n=1 Tax=Providencia stuartii TaxID=588 RepID=UPI000B33A7C7|nr:YdgH/BhsA/McbA-like domain containing protein [Providencia stuartii]
MKKIIALFVLSLVSYQGVAANNQTYSQQASNKVTENYTHKKILSSATFIGDASLSSIETQAQETAKKIGASSYKIVGASGETKLRGHVIFYQ